MADISITLGNIQHRLEYFAEEFAYEFEERVRERTPVQSGALQDGWHVTNEGDTIVIENPVPYAAFVEYGTPYMEPRAMLRTTLAEKNEITKIAIERASE